MTEPAKADAEGVGAFERFFHTHYERLLRAMYLATGDRYEAEDLAQDAFVRVYERWTRVRETENPVGYLYRTALNARRSRLRRLAVATRKLFHQGAPESQGDLVEAAGERDTIRRALASLPAGQREVVVLVEWLGMTDAQAGEVLGVTPGAVRARLHRARAALRAQPRGADDE